jgi:predicted TIM-barrel fold metal-dependent hydrolase
MKIDAFPHILPQKYYRKLLEKAPKNFYMEKRWKGIPALTDIEKRFQVMDRFEDYAQVLVLSAPPLEMVFSPADTPELARIANDEMAELVAKYPDRFVAAVATLPMNNKDAAAEELDRAIKQLNMKGVLVYTNSAGKPLDDPDFTFIFEKMAAYDLPIWLHPARGAGFSDYTSEEKSKFDVWVIFGWPFDTSAAMVRIVFTGVFDRYPNLKIIAHHLGGMLPYFGERLRGAYDNFGTRTEEDAAGILAGLKKHPYDYFRMFYADTVINGSIPALECAYAFFGADRILFGTDMPFDPDQGYRKIKRNMEGIEGMTACIEDKEKIYRGNAVRLLKLDKGP